MNFLNVFAVRDPVAFVVQGMVLTYILYALEYITLFSWLDGVNPLSWIFTRERFTDHVGVADSSILTLVMSARGYVLLSCVRIACAVALLLAGYQAPGSALLVAILLLILIVDFVRQPEVLEGAEEMLLVVNVGVLLPSLLPRSHFANTLTALFIGAQLVLSYLSAGIAKLVSKRWRDGTAIFAIMTSSIYGHHWASAVFERSHKLRIFCSWMVILWESLFCLLIWIDVARPIVLLIGVAFHLANAVFLGLNRFVIIFISCYPIMVYLVTRYT